MPVKNKSVTIAKNKAGDLVMKIEFPYDLDTLDQVRSLPGRRYHGEEKCWSAPIYIKSLKLLMRWQFDIDDKLRKILLEANKKTKEIPKEILGFNTTLYPFQHEGVSFIESNKGRVLIADEMGLGKTIQALAWLHLHPELRPVIIVVPASLKFNWKLEAEVLMPNPKVEILSGSKTWKITGDIIIINYDILYHWMNVLSKLNPKVLITDEAHYYKNNKAKRTKAVKKLAKNIEHVLALTGTPIVNRPIEMYNALNIISPELFPNLWYYAQRYCNAKHNGFGWDFSGSSNTQELHKKLVDSIMIRRLKKDVLKELPDKTRSFVPIELDNSKDYIEAENDFVSFIQRTKGQAKAEKASSAEVLVQIELLKQLAVTGKLKQAVDWVNNFIQIGDKLVVFGVHRFVIEHLMGQFGDIAVKVDGSVSGIKRQEAVEKFQNDPNIRLFIGNIKAAGIGITLTAASTVAFLELPWTPGELVQAEDRCHRIGQKDSVNIYYLLAMGTIEEKIAKLIDEKRKVLDAVLDGKDTDSESLLTELLNQYK